MMALLPEVKQELLETDLTELGPKRQQFLLASSLSNMVSLSRKDSRMEAIQVPLEII